MKLVKCLAVAALALSACKKDDSKPAAASASGSGTASASASASGSGTASASASASGSGTASASASAAPKTPPAAMAGFATIAKSEEKAASGMAAGTGGGGGIGGALGGIFGGGDSAAAGQGAPGNDKQVADEDHHHTDDPNPPSGDDTPDEDNSGFDLSKIVFPPAGAKGGDCGAVADRIMLMVAAIIQDEIKQLPPDQQKTAQEMAGKEMRDSMVQACTDQKWSQDLRDCVLTAMDKTALQACEKLAPKDAPPTAEPDTDEPAKAAPAWSGGNACADVGARMKQLAEAQIGDVPADQQGQVDTQLDAQVKQVVDACTQGAWTDAQRTCIVQASDLDRAGTCLGGS